MNRLACALLALSCMSAVAANAASYGVARRLDATVIRVIDGTTIEVTLGGRAEVVRYVGVREPRSLFASAARLRKENERLVAGRRVTLSFGTEERDEKGVLSRKAASRQRGAVEGSGAEMNERLCRRRLAAIWLAGGGFILLLLVGQDLGNIYGDQSERAWAWFSGTVLPTLSLMIGTFAAHARLNTAEPDARVDPMAFYSALGLSIIFLLLVLMTLIQPLSTSTPLQLMTRSNLYLAPVQGLVGLALGAFFVSRRSD